MAAGGYYAGHARLKTSVDEIISEEVKLIKLLLLLLSSH